MQGMLKARRRRACATRRVMVFEDEVVEEGFGECVRRLERSSGKVGYGGWRPSARLCADRKGRERGWMDGWMDGW